MAAYGSRIDTVIVKIGNGFKYVLSEKSVIDLDCIMVDGEKLYPQSPPYVGMDAKIIINKKSRSLVGFAYNIEDRGLLRLFGDVDRNCILSLAEKSDRIPSRLRDYFSVDGVLLIKWSCLGPDDILDPIGQCVSYLGDVWFYASKSWLSRKKLPSCIAFTGLAAIQKDYNVLLSVDAEVDDGVLF